MRGFNRAIIAGNLTRDPDLRYTVNKRAFARFGVAVNYRYKNSNGEYQDGTDYINVVAWGSLGETCGKYLKKGSPVLIEGRISTSTYEARDGSGKKYMTEIMADNMVMLGSRENTSSMPGSPDDIPSEESFGGRVGANGFNGGEPPQGFEDDGDDDMPESGPEQKIPF